MNQNQDKFILSDLFSKTYDRLSQRRQLFCSKGVFKAAFLAAWFSDAGNQDLSIALSGMNMNEVKEELINTFRIARCQEKLIARIGMIFLSTGEVPMDKAMESMADEMLQDQSTEEAQGSPGAGEEIENLEEEEEISERQRSDPILLLYNIKKTRRGETARRDNFLLKHYRGMKRSIKYFKNGKPFTSSLLRMTAINGAHNTQYSALRTFYESHCEGLKQWRKDFDEHMPMSIIFAGDLAREYNVVFTDWLYCGSPEEMCTKFKVKCCRGKHSERCREVWTLAKDYMKKLGIDKRDR